MAGKILYVCQEIFPYLPESEQSALCRQLVQAMQERGNEIRTFMPRYGCINERRNQLHEVIRLSGMNLIIDDNDHQLIIKVASIPTARVQIYFIDNDDYFARKAVLSDDAGWFADNDERAIFFARGVLETVKKLRWNPSVVHCHGWFSAVVPIYLKHMFADDPVFRDVKIAAGRKSENSRQFVIPKPHAFRYGLCRRHRARFGRGRCRPGGVCPPQRQAGIGVSGAGGGGIR